jgi:hypothetical protein
VDAHPRDVHEIAWSSSKWTRSRIARAQHTSPARSTFFYDFSLLVPHFLTWIAHAGLFSHPATEISLRTQPWCSVSTSSSLGRPYPPPPRLHTTDRSPPSTTARVHHHHAAKQGVRRLHPSLCASILESFFFCEAILESPWRNWIGTEAERPKAFSMNLWPVFVTAIMWLQSLSGTGYLFGAISPVVKTALGYNQRQVAAFGITKDIEDCVRFFAGMLSAMLLIGAV